MARERCSPLMAGTVAARWPAMTAALGTEGAAASKHLPQHDEVQIVALRDAEAVVAVRERLDLTGGHVAATRIPGQQRFANVDDGHLDLPGASLANPLLRRGEEFPTQSPVLLAGVDGERAQVPHAIIFRLKPDTAEQDV